MARKPQSIVGGGFSFIQPKDIRSSNYKDLQTIDEKTLSELRENTVIDLRNAWAANTIAYQYMRNLVAYLQAKFIRSGGNTTTSIIQYFDILTASVTYHTSDKNEKEGNINVVYHIGKIFENIEKGVPTKMSRMVDPSEIDHSDIEKAKREYDGSGFLIPTNIEMYNDLSSIDKACKRDLQEKYHITIAHDWLCTTVTAYFMKNLYYYLYALVQDKELPTYMVNFMDVIEITCRKSYKDNDRSKGMAYYLDLYPGVMSKLLIKSDQFTEADDSDDDDLPF